MAYLIDNEQEREFSIGVLLTVRDRTEDLAIERVAALHLPLDAEKRIRVSQVFGEVEIEYADNN